MLANKTITTLYNPGEKDREVLKAEFVIRLKEFNNIFNDIKTSKMEKPEQHYLLIGQRGSGKSTLIQRLRYAIEDDAELSRWLIPIAFTEEQYNITELGNLWERIAENLEDYHHMPGIVADLEKQLDKKDAEKKQLDTLLSYLRKNGKKIVVFIDNIGDMLRKFEDIEVKRLRSVLQTVPEIRIIAATPVMLDEVSDYQKALFEFFKNIRLGGLSKEEMETLLRQLGKTHDSSNEIEKIIKESPERIEILRRLTGGIARTVVMMYNVFIENAEGNPIGDLQKILDEATPLYKHKMDDLPVQQQKIVDAVAKNWESISAGELAEKLRMESKNVSAHLRQLEKDQWIEKIETDTKNNFYQIQERFFNIWYLMRYGRSFEKTRVIWLVKFMENLFEKTELENRMKQLLDKMIAKNSKEEEVLFWTDVYLECSKVSPFLKFVLLQKMEQYFTNKLEPNTSSVAKRKETIWSEIFEYPQKLNKDEIESILTLSQKRPEWIELNLRMNFNRIAISLTEKGNNEAMMAWIHIISTYSQKDKTGFLDFLLADLYREIRMSEKSQAQWRTALEKGNLYAVIDVALFARLEKGNTLAPFVKLINEQYKGHVNYKLLLANSYMRNNQIQESRQIINELIQTNREGVSGLTMFPLAFEFLLLSMAKEQFQTALELITDEGKNLKSELLPIYYALMHYMKDEYPNEYLRMPPEMKETVEDVIKKIEEYKVKYA